MFIFQAHMVNGDHILSTYSNLIKKTCVFDVCFLITGNSAHHLIIGVLLRRVTT